MMTVTVRTTIFLSRVIMCRAIMTRWQSQSTSIEEDIDMAKQSDDEYDTPESCAQLADLMAHTLSPASNHDLNQIAQSHISGIQLDYIQLLHHDKSPLASCIFDDIFHVQN